MKEIAANAPQHFWAQGQTSDAGPRPAAVLAGESFEGGVISGAPSLAQRRLWFWDQLHPGNSAYNIPTATEIIGGLEPERFQRALRVVMDRHDALRSRFSVVEGSPVLEVERQVPPPLEILDFSHLPEAEREVELGRVREKEFDRVFALNNAPLFQVRLIRMGPARHVMLFTIHHIIYDMGSHQIFLKELAEEYERGGMDQNVRGERRAFFDFAQKQAAARARGVEEELKFWRLALSGELAPLALPTDFGRPAKATFKGGMLGRKLDGGLLEGIRKVSRRLRVTPYMFCLGGFATLLRRYSGQREVLIGVPVTSRNAMGMERVVGLLLNILPIRVQFLDGLTVEGLMQQIRGRVLDAMEHPELPFERLMEELRLDRGAGSDPFFQVMFDYQNPAASSFESGSVRWLPLPTYTRTSKFDLTLLMRETADGLSAHMEYSSDLYRPETVERMLDHGQMLLDGMAKEPSQRVTAVPMITAMERQQVLVDWNQTATEYPREKTVAELFAEQAGRNPDSIALVFQHRAGCGCEKCQGAVRAEGGAVPLTERMTYGELNGRAGELARRLGVAGVTRESRVGLYAERSVEAIVGMLAILKAGAAYVPVDPAYPAERAAYMLEDSGVKVTLASGKHKLALPPCAGEVIGLDDSGAGSWRNGVGAGGSHVKGTPLSAAYVMYTSGSTGRPKGVIVSNRGIVRLVKGTNYWSPSGREVMLQFAPLTFDASTFEIWGALLNGGQLVLMPSNPVSLEELSEAIRRHGVTSIWLTAGLFHLFVDERIDALRSLRQVFAGGDVLSAARCERFLRELPGVRLLNCYGPTENTTFTTWHEVGKGETKCSTVPIGRPIANTRVYILDAELEPVPVGIPGELHISGDGLALGYLNDEALTAARFIENPFEENGASRLYKTGDQARYLPDGTIEFLGRRDHQVKIRGFRIELPEIELMLNRHPGVLESVLVVQEEQGAKRLVAYWVARGGHCPEPEELRDFLRERLPDYMVPAVFVRLQSFLLNENGKVDRRALPKPDLEPADGSPPLAEPRNAVEEKLAEIWRELLGIERVGIHDNFFLLGGHSLLATQAVSRISREFAVQLPLSSFFEARTIARLGTVIEEGRLRNFRPIPRRGSRGNQSRSAGIGFADRVV